MSKLIIIIFLTFVLDVNISFSQYIENLFMFEDSQYNGPYKVEEILKEIKFDSLKKVNKKNYETRVYTYNYDGKDRYIYWTTNDIVDFELIGFKDEVLSLNYDFNSLPSRSSSNFRNPVNIKSRINFFDRTVYMKFIDYKLPDLPSQFRLNSGLSNSELQSYYNLLGVNSALEYGWSCEYGAAGRTTPQRNALMDLIEGENVHIFKLLLSYPRIEIRLYAFEALFFLDYITRQKIEFAEFKLNKYRNIKDSLLYQTDISISKNNSMFRIYNYYYQWELSHLEYLQSIPLNITDFEFVNNLKNSNDSITTCGNFGSYKLYKTPIKEIVNDDYIDIIIGKFKYINSIFIRDSKQSFFY